ncbi:hypothetical protein Hamer_G018329, partial [Homarus americanus]
FRPRIEQNSAQNTVAVRFSLPQKTAGFSPKYLQVSPMRRQDSILQCHADSCPVGEDGARICGGCPRIKDLPKHGRILPQEHLQILPQEQIPPDYVGFRPGHLQDSPSEYGGRFHPKILQIPPLETVVSPPQATVGSRPGAFADSTPEDFVQGCDSALNTVGFCLKYGEGFCQETVGFHLRTCVIPSPGEVDSGSEYGRIPASEYGRFCPRRRRIPYQYTAGFRLRIWDDSAPGRGRIPTQNTVGFRLRKQLDSASEYSRIPPQNTVGFRLRIQKDSTKEYSRIPPQNTVDYASEYKYSRILPQETVGFRLRIPYDSTSEYRRIPPKNTVGFRLRIRRIQPQNSVGFRPRIGQDSDTGDGRIPLQKTVGLSLRIRRILPQDTLGFRSEYSMIPPQNSVGFRPRIQTILRKVSEVLTGERLIHYYQFLTK